MTSNLPTVVLISTGGTIASRIDPETGAVSALHTAEELLAMVPGLDEVATIEIVSFTSVNSWNMTPQMMFDLVTETLRQVERDDVHGVVVTHGTDTVEETSLMADLLLDTKKPVVFTAAMRNLSETGADGPRNLADAIRVAASPDANGRDVMLVVNEGIHSARYVTKTNTVNTSTFQSPDFGPIGQVTSNGIRFLHFSPQREVVRADRIVSDVAVVSAVAGVGPEILEWHVERGVAGIVLEGSGAGNIPGTLLPGVPRVLESGIPIVLTSRVASGFLSPTYGTGGASGGGFDLMRMGVIPSVYWRSPKARIAMMVALGAGLSQNALRELLARP